MTSAQQLLRRLICFHFLRLGRSEEGSIAIYMSISIVALIGLAGLALDGARVYSVKTRLQESLDAAALAATQSTDKEREDTAIRYFHSNYGRFLESELKEPATRYDAQERELSMDVAATVPVTFMKLFGFDEVTVRVSTTIKRQISELEAALVLDVSTSMGQYGRIESLRQATRDFIDVLYGKDDRINEIRVSIVPYTGSVNIGNGFKKWTTPQWEDWKGCVHDRAGSSKGDAPPSSGHFKTDFYHPEHPFIQWEDQARRKGWTKTGKRSWVRKANAAEVIASLGALRFVPEKNPHTHPSEERQFCTSSVVEPLRSNRPALLNDLRGIQATTRYQTLRKPPSNGTRTDLGLLWGWRTLSPQWRTLWSGSPRVTNYHQDGVTKAVVLMTDGSNTANISRHLTANKIDQNMDRICADMKQRDGIIVYVVALEVKQAAFKQRLRRCASSASHYFESVSREDLRQAFQTVANQLIGLRVTQ